MSPVALRYPTNSTTHSSVVFCSTREEVSAEETINSNSHQYASDSFKDSHCGSPSTKRESTDFGSHGKLLNRGGEDDRLRDDFGSGKAAKSISSEVGKGFRLEVEAQRYPRGDKRDAPSRLQGCQQELSTDDCMEEVSEDGTQCRANGSAGGSSEDRPAAQVGGIQTPFRATLYQSGSFDSVGGVEEREHVEFTLLESCLDAWGIPPSFPSQQALPTCIATKFNQAGNHQSETRAAYWGKDDSSMNQETQSTALKNTSPPSVMAAVAARSSGMMLFDGTYLEKIKRQGRTRTFGAPSWIGTDEDFSEPANTASGHPQQNWQVKEDGDSGSKKTARSGMENNLIDYPVWTEAVKLSLADDVRTMVESVTKQTSGEAPRRVFKRAWESSQWKQFQVTQRAERISPGRR